MRESAEISPEFSFDNEKAIAKSFSKRFQWEMILIGVGQATIWLSLWPLVLNSYLPLWVGFFIASLCACFAYLPSHEAQHGNYSRGNPTRKWLDAFVLLVVPGNVCHQVLDHRKSLYRTHGNKFIGTELIDASHATEARATIDLHAAGTTFARLAIPANSKVAGMLGLYQVDGIEDHHASIELDCIFLELSPFGVSTPNFKDTFSHRRQPPVLPKWRLRCRPS